MGSVADQAELLRVCNFDAAVFAARLAARAAAPGGIADTPATAVAELILMFETRAPSWNPACIVLTPRQSGLVEDLFDSLP
jgi:hypothetical protein